MSAQQGPPRTEWDAQNQAKQWAVPEDDPDGLEEFVGYLPLAKVKELQQKYNARLSELNSLNARVRADEALLPSKRAALGQLRQTDPFGYRQRLRELDQEQEKIQQYSAALPAEMAKVARLKRVADEEADVGWAQTALRDVGRIAAQPIQAMIGDPWSRKAMSARGSTDPIIPIDAMMRMQAYRSQGRFAPHTSMASQNVTGLNSGDTWDWERFLVHGGLPGQMEEAGGLLGGLSSGQTDFDRGTKETTGTRIGRTTGMVASFGLPGGPVEAVGQLGKAVGLAGKATKIGSLANIGMKAERFATKPGVGAALTARAGGKVLGGAAAGAVTGGVMGSQGEDAGFMSTARGAVGGAMIGALGGQGLGMLQNLKRGGIRILTQRGADDFLREIAEVTPNMTAKAAGEALKDTPEGRAALTSISDPVEFAAQYKNVRRDRIVSAVSEVRAGKNPDFDPEMGVFEEPRFGEVYKAAKKKDPSVTQDQVWEQLYDQENGLEVLAVQLDRSGLHAPDKARWESLRTVLSGMGLADPSTPAMREASKRILGSQEVPTAGSFLRKQLGVVPSKDIPPELKALRLEARRLLAKKDLKWADVNAWRAKLEARGDVLMEDLPLEEIGQSIAGLGKALARDGGEWEILKSAVGRFAPEAIPDAPPIFAAGSRVRLPDGRIFTVKDSFPTGSGWGNVLETDKGTVWVGNEDALEGAQRSLGTPTGGKEIFETPPRARPTSGHTFEDYDTGLVGKSKKPGVEQPDVPERGVFSAEEQAAARSSEMYAENPEAWRKGPEAQDTPGSVPERLTAEQQEAAKATQMYPTPEGAWAKGQAKAAQTAPDAPGAPQTGKGVVQPSPGAPPPATQLEALQAATGEASLDDMMEALVQEARTRGLNEGAALKAVGNLSDAEVKAAYEALQKPQGETIVRALGGTQKNTESGTGRKAESQFARRVRETTALEKLGYSSIAPGTPLESSRIKELMRPENNRLRSEIIARGIKGSDEEGLLALKRELAGEEAQKTVRRLRALDAIGQMPALKLTPEQLASARSGDKRGAELVEAVVRAFVSADSKFGQEVVNFLTERKIDLDVEDLNLLFRNKKTPKQITEAMNAAGRRRPPNRGMTLSMGGVGGIQELLAPVMRKIWGGMVGGKLSRNHLSEAIPKFTLAMYGESDRIAAELRAGYAEGRIPKHLQDAVASVVQGLSDPDDAVRAAAQGIAKQLSPRSLGVYDKYWTDLSRRIRHSGFVMQAFSDGWRQAQLHRDQLDQVRRLSLSFLNRYSDEERTRIFQAIDMGTVDQLSGLEQAAAAYTQGLFEKMLDLGNDVRVYRGKDPIRYRKNYVTHVFDSFAGRMEGVPGTEILSKYGQARTGDPNFYKDIAKATNAYLSSMFTEVSWGGVYDDLEMLKPILQGSVYDSIKRGLDISSGRYRGVGTRAVEGLLDAFTGFVGKSEWSPHVKDRVFQATQGLSQFMYMGRLGLGNVKSALVQVTDQIAGLTGGRISPKYLMQALSMHLQAGMGTRGLGAATGGIYGFATGDDLEEKILRGVGGAVAGGVAGAAASKLLQKNPARAKLNAIFEQTFGRDPAWAKKLDAEIRPLHGIYQKIADSPLGLGPFQAMNEYNHRLMATAAWIEGEQRLGKTGRGLLEHVRDAVQASGSWYLRSSNPGIYGETGPYLRPMTAFTSYPLRITDAVAQNLYETMKLVKSQVPAERAEGLKRAGNTTVAVGSALGLMAIGAGLGVETAHDIVPLYGAITGEGVYHNSIYEAAKNGLMDDNDPRKRPTGDLIKEALLPTTYTRLANLTEFGDGQPNRIADMGRGPVFVSARGNTQGPVTERGRAARYLGFREKSQQDRYDKAEEFQEEGRSLDAKTNKILWELVQAYQTKDLKVWQTKLRELAATGRYATMQDVARGVEARLRWAAMLPEERAVEQLPKQRRLQEQLQMR
jgi:hypothetical protein